MLEGRHGGLVGTKALGEKIGPCLLYGYDYGFVSGFLRFLLQASGCCRRVVWLSASSFASQWMFLKGLLF